MPTARPHDVESIDAIIAALYDTISGPAGTRDWDRLRSLFAEGGRLVPTREQPNGETGIAVMDVEQFIEDASPFMAENAFYEREIARRTELFGHIAHVFSTYETHLDESDPVPHMRGINSIQLVNGDERWWVLTIFWENERSDRLIPERYEP